MDPKPKRFTSPQKRVTAYLNEEERIMPRRVATHARARPLWTELHLRNALTVFSCFFVAEAWLGRFGPCRRWCSSFFVRWGGARGTGGVYCQTAKVFEGDALPAFDAGSYAALGARSSVRENSGCLLNP